MSGRTSNIDQRNVARPNVGRRNGLCRIFSGALLGVLLCTGCESGSAKRNAKLAYWHLRLGKDYLGKKKAPLAKAELLRAVKLDPKNAEVHTLLGMIYFHEGVYAIGFIDRSQCIRGEAADQQRSEANRIFRLSEGHLRKSLKLGEKGKQLRELELLANIAIHFGRYDEAITLCGRALENITSTTRQTFLGIRGQARFKKGDLKQASEDLRLSLFHQPKYCVSRFWLAKVLYKRKDHDAAISELERIVKDDCPLQEAHQLLGLAYLKKQAAEKARVQFEKCVARNPKSCVSRECQRYVKMI